MVDYLYDNETIKWENEGKLYCLHIQEDTDPRATCSYTNLVA